MNKTSKTPHMTVCIHHMHPFGMFRGNYGKFGRLPKERGRVMVFGRGGPWQGTDAARLRKWYGLKGTVAEDRPQLECFRSLGCLATYFRSSKYAYRISLRSRAGSDETEGEIVESAAVGDDTLDATRSATTVMAKSSSDLSCIGTGSEVKCVVPQREEGASSGKDLGNGTVAMEADEKEVQSFASFVLESLLLISPFFFWGTSMVAMKQLDVHTTPLFIAAWRLLPAGFVLLAWAALTGRKQPETPMAWVAVSLFALVDGTFFQGFLAEGLQRTSAGLGSVIIDSQPLSVAVLASILFGERLGRSGASGLALGIIGLLLLEAPMDILQTFMPFDFASTDSEVVKHSSDILLQQGSIWDSGEWWMLLAAQSMAVGTVMVRWVAKYCDPVIATGWHMILGSLPLVFLSLWQDGPELTSRLSQLTSGDIGLLIYVTLLGSAASYGIFFYEATVRGNLTALSSLTFLTPMFAALGGFLVLGETLTPQQLVGAAITLGGVTLINGNSDNK